MAVSNTCTAHTTQEGVNVTFDWRISVQPPLLVHNTLPVGAKYVVWERSVPGGMASSGGQGVLQACAWGWLEAWGTAHVYAADMRQQVGVGVCLDVSGLCFSSDLLAYSA